MIPTYLFELLRFVLLFGLMVVFCFGIIYYKEKRNDYPFILLGIKKINFFNALYYYTIDSVKWLILPFILYCLLACFGFLFTNWFTKIITVYDKGEHIGYTKAVLLFSKPLNNGMVAKPFEQDEIIENNSSIRLKLRKNVYQRNFGVTRDSYIVINPQTTFYCTDNNYPEYILEPAPILKRVRSSEERIAWSLEKE